MHYITVIQQLQGKENINIPIADLYTILKYCCKYAIISVLFLITKGGKKVSIYDVFISYRRSDGQKIAEELYTYLTSNGVRVFLDRATMIDGHYFTTQIESHLKLAPNYVLIATDDVFQFREDEDWVKREMEIAIEEYEKSPIEKTITVLTPDSAKIPLKNNLPKSVCNIADAQRIVMPFGADITDSFYRVLTAVTRVNRRNLWFAAHRWLESSKQPGGRFANVNISESILPSASTKKAHISKCQSTL